jgi:hypothetical protein
MRRLFVLLAVSALIAACGDDDDGTDSATTTTTEQPTEVTVDDSQTTTAPTTAPAPDAVPIDLTVRGGALVGEPTRVQVPVGESGIITVDADSEIEIHFHGYDLFAEAGPGSPGVIDFEASIPGVFEVEIEGSGVLLAEIEVS